MLLSIANGINDYNMLLIVTLIGSSREDPDVRRSVHGVVAGPSTAHREPPRTWRK